MAVALYNEECLAGMSRIETGSVDMILCDLPYGTTQNKWDSIIPLEPLWKEYKRIIKRNGAIVLTAQVPFNITLGASNLSWLRYEWLWKKENGTGFLNAKKMPLKNHENVLVFYKHLPTYNPQMTVGRPYTCKRGVRNSTNYRPDIPAWTTVNQGDRYPRTVLEFKYDLPKLHPTQKPVALFEYMIRTYTNPGETVLDNCMGSGTTGVACVRSERDFIGFELDAKYFEIAQKRIAEAQTPKKIATLEESLFERDDAA